jgi:hypothetical protein
LEKHALELARRRPLDPKVHVAPFADAWHSPPVFVADVVSAGKRNRTVHHEDLSVVSQVHGLQQDVAHRQEARDSSSRVDKRLSP